MKITKLPYSATGAFSKLLTDYLNQDAALKPFYNRYPELAAFKEQIEEKQFAPENREILCRVLAEQYKSVEHLNPVVQKNIDLLAQPNTYTVTTGHQLNIFTGPLYFIYKIITTINLATKLKETYPDYNFVPVYWMATEDHDFAEINHFTLFGKLYTWESEQRGAVGRFQVNEMTDFLDALPEHHSLFEDAYKQSNSLADASRRLTHDLFGQYGLVALDGDNPELKSIFKPVIKEELQSQVSHQVVTKTSEALAQNYKPQVMSRDINLFYLDNGMRERLVLENGRYQVLNSDRSFFLSEIEELLETEPEKFSPNVILRPLYQEMVLPNLAYIGGGAEVAYWFQLKVLFEHFKVPFPVVMLRNSALYISKPNAGRMQKLNLGVADLFKDTADLKKQITSRFEEESLNLDTEKKQVAAIFEQISKLATSIDATLTKTVAAEAQKTQNALEMLEKKIIKANDSKYEIYFNQLTNLKEKLFPGGTLQERVDNILTYHTNNPEFISHLAKAFDPLDGTFTILEEE